MADERLDGGAEHRRGLPSDTSTHHQRTIRYRNGSLR
jgi:hypothetical protein